MEKEGWLQQFWCQGTVHRFLTCTLYSFSCLNFPAHKPGIEHIIPSSWRVSLPHAHWDHAKKKTHYLNTCSLSTKKTQFATVPAGDIKQINNKSSNYGFLTMTRDCIKKDGRCFQVFLTDPSLDSLLLTPKCSSWLCQGPFRHPASLVIA